MRSPGMITGMPGGYGVRSDLLGADTAYRLAGGDGVLRGKERVTGRMAGSSSSAAALGSSTWLARGQVAGVFDQGAQGRHQPGRDLVVVCQRQGGLDAAVIAEPHIHVLVLAQPVCGVVSADAQAGDARPVPPAPERADAPDAAWCHSAVGSTAAAHR